MGGQNEHVRKLSVLNVGELQSVVECGALFESVDW